MALYGSVSQAMVAVEALLKQGFPPELSGGIVNGKVQLLSSADMKKRDGSVLGIWVHRLTVDLNGRNRFLPPATPNGVPRPELPLNAHFLLMSWSPSAEAEIRLHAWGIQELMARPEIGIAELGATDADWSASDSVQIVPEEMATEDLLRIWDALPSKYTLSSSWVLRTIRLSMAVEPPGPPVVTRVFPMGTP